MANQPDIIPSAWAANNSTINAIPETTTESGKASWDQGFPIETSRPLSQGGIPPQYGDFNGILNILSQFAVYAQSGGQYAWSNTLDYAVGSIVLGIDGKIYRALKISGPSTSSVNPVGDTSGKWSAIISLDDLDSNIVLLSGDQTISGNKILRDGLYVGQWSATLIYPQATIVKGSDGNLYVAVQPNGPGTTIGVIDPISGATYSQITPVPSRPPYGTTDHVWKCISRNNVLNVRDFGATGDGVTNDTSAVQAAFDAAVGTWYTVYFPAGIYRVNNVTAMCNVKGDSDWGSVLKGNDNSVGQVLTLWTGSTASYPGYTADQIAAIRRNVTISDIAIEAQDGQNGLRVYGAYRANLTNIRVKLNGAGSGILTDPASTKSRFIRLDNFSITGVPGFATIGLDLANAQDSRISQGEIMQCQIGIDVKTGTSCLIMSDVHIWCGDSSPYNHAAWWNETLCIHWHSRGHYLFSNLYCDSAHTVFSSQIISSSGASVSIPLDCQVSNFTYWDATSNYTPFDEYNESIFANLGADSHLEINGGTIYLNTKLKRIYQVSNFSIVRHNNVSVIVPTAPDLTEFVASNYGWPRSSLDNNRYFVHYDADSNGSNKYALFAIVVRNNTGGCCVLNLNSSRQTLIGQIEIFSNNLIKYYSSSGAQQEVYYRRDTTNDVFYLYVLKGTNENLITVDVAQSGANSCYAVLLDRILKTNYERYKPADLTSADGLTKITKTIIS